MSLSPEVKAAIAKRSRTKGSNYERTVAKKIATYFGWKWDDCFIRTSLSSYAQPHGDLRPINEMKNLWEGAKLGPLECKSRKEWSYENLLKNPIESTVVGYWLKSNKDTNCQNSIVVFTKPAISDMVLHADDGCYNGPTIRFTIDGIPLIIQTLKHFLESHWAK